MIVGLSERKRLMMEILPVLQEMAKNGDKPIFYSELAEKVGSHHRSKIFHKALIDVAAMEPKKYILTSLVVYKDDPRTTGEGFFVIAENRYSSIKREALTSADKRKLLANEQSKVFDYFNRP